MPSFTQRVHDLEETGPLITIMLTAADDFLRIVEGSPQANTTITVSAMIDTGASGTVIRKGIASELGLNPIGQTLLNTPSSIDVECNQFDVQLIFPNNVIIESIVVTEAPLQNQHVQCLIGRDILKHGVLIYNGYDNSFILSF